jgi:hypothetical protein
LKDFNFDFCHVFLRYSGILRFGVQVYFLATWSFAMAKDKKIVIENINEVDEVLLDANTIPF